MKLDVRYRAEDGAGQTTRFCAATPIQGSLMTTDTIGEASLEFQPWLDSESGDVTCALLDAGAPGLDLAGILPDELRPQGAKRKARDEDAEEEEGEKEEEGEDDAEEEEDEAEEEEDAEEDEDFDEDEEDEDEDFDEDDEDEDEEDDDYDNPDEDDDFDDDDDEEEFEEEE
jgi:hypothetical protein